MAITERTVYDAITILEDGQLQMRKARIIMDEDGTEISRQYHREVLEPGQSIEHLPARAQEIATAIWTPAVTTQFATAKAERVAATLDSVGVQSVSKL
jgi:hypothetical protein